MRNIRDFVLVIIEVYVWLIIIRVILSWIPSSNSSLFRSIYRFLYDVTEPYLGLFRRLLPTIGRGGVGIDLSPILAIIVLFVIEYLIRRAI